MSFASNVAKLVAGLLVAATFTFIPQAAQAAPFTDFSYRLNSSNEAIVTGCNSACPSTLDIPSTLGGAPVAFRAGLSWDYHYLPTTDIGAVGTIDEHVLALELGATYVLQ